MTAPLFGRALHGSAFKHSLLYRQDCVAAGYTAYLVADNDVRGATKASYTTPVTTKAYSGALFSVVVTNEAGSITSRDAVLTVN